MKKILLIVAVLFFAIGCSDQSTQNEESKTSEENEVSQTQNYEEGVHYTVLNEEVSLQNEARSDKGDYVIEYFWLGCEHCQNFEAIIGSYEESNPDVFVKRRHAALSDRWALDARIYYALLETGNMHLYKDLMDLYIEKRTKERSLPEIQDVNTFLEEHDINPEAFLTVADSDLVLTHIERSINDMNKNDITAVPTVVVAGKYKIAHQLPEDMRTQEDYNNLVNYLISKKQQEESNE